MKASVGKGMVILPADDEAIVWLAKKPVGDEFDFEPLNPRSIQFNNYIFACIAKVAQAHKVETDTMRARLLIATGRFRMIKVTEAKRVMVLPSMSRGNWTMKQLNEFWDDARAFILDHLLNGITNQEADDIRRMLDDPTVREQAQAS